MSAKKYVFSFLSLSLFLVSCRGHLNNESVTYASLKRIDKIWSDCKKNKVQNIEKCLVLYSRENNIDYHGLITDGYGNEIFLFIDKIRCENADLRVPYSAGRNGIDDCGEKDDIKLN
jgi:hypothetical protein